MCIRDRVYSNDTKVNDTPLDVNWEIDKNGKISNENNLVIDNNAGFADTGTCQLTANYSLSLIHI